MTGLLKGVVFLAADTVRSRAYAQILVYHGILVEAILIIESPIKKWGQSNEIEAGDINYGSLFVPKLNRSLRESCRGLSDTLNVTDTGSINSAAVVSWLKKNQPELVIYSGFGGELVKPSVLRASGPLLHIHAGYLPDYRGSTTVYYSYLKENNVGVSAILLEEKIDEGAIVVRQKYAPPHKGAEIDYYYDSVVRADLLIKALRKYSPTTGKFIDMLGSQPENEGVVYYIIHPLLKHIVLNNLEKKV